MTFDESYFSVERSYCKVNKLNNLIDKSLDYLEMQSMEEVTSNQDFVEVKQELSFELDLIQEYSLTEVSLKDTSFSDLKTIAYGFLEVMCEPKELTIQEYDLSDFQFKPFK